MKVSEIKNSLKEEFAAFTPNQMMDIATKYIMTLENDMFWKYVASSYIGNAIGLVMTLAGSGILIEVSTCGKIAKMSQETGEITVSKI